MSKVLFLTSRNVVSNNGKVSGVGAATLIFRRATALYKVLGLKTYILPLNGVVKNAETGHVGSEFLMNNRSIQNTISEFCADEVPKIIIYSGDKTYFYIKTINELVNQKVPALLDLHGALEEGIEYNKGLKFLNATIRYKIKKYNFKKASKKIEGLLGVSDELLSHHLEILPKETCNRLTNIKIRCGVNEVDRAKEKSVVRSNIRKSWGVYPSTQVYVYSGHKANWQCIDETIEFFKMVNEKNPDSFFVFFTKNESSFIEKLEKSFPNQNFYCGLIPHNHINDYLTACDIGIIMRHDNYTNRVAFPNKFSDYVNAGLILILSESLKEPVRLLNSHNIPYMSIKPNDTNFEFTEDKIVYRFNNLEKFYSMCDSLVKSELLYEVQIQKQSKVIMELLKK